MKVTFSEGQPLLRMSLGWDYFYSYVSTKKGSQKKVFNGTFLYKEFPAR